MTRVMCEKLDKVRARARASELETARDEYRRIERYRMVRCIESQLRDDLTVKMTNEENTRIIEICVSRFAYLYLYHRNYRLN